MRTLLAAILMLPSLAHADCPVDKSVRVSVSCSAEMIGLDSSKLSLSDRTQPAALEVTGPSKSVKLAWGDYRLVGELQCSGKSNDTMAWGLHVELTRKNTPAPLAYMLVGAPDAAARKGKPPVTVTSYHYFEPSIPHPNKPGGKLTRLDYTCELRVD